MLQGRTLKRFEKVIRKAAKNVNDSYLSRNLYGRLHFIGKAICVSPIPGLASHLHHDTLTPHFEEKKQLDRLLNNVTREA
ncbi:MAG: hypothetical protein D6767_10100 [Candidatus Hydrogenedentota bacterium]|nr:MAG: hypothetical protein D6767_10100 [Candidatus Hydrogenedentota bacterium]